MSTIIGNRYSFDRFGDDLSEVLLSYLRFHQRFKYECVSKQFRRTIFITQTELTLDYYTVGQQQQQRHQTVDTNNADNNNPKILESILRKCPNLYKLTVGFDARLAVDNQFFELLMKYCPNLREFRLNTNSQPECCCYQSSEIVDQFFRQFGHQLTELRYRIPRNLLLRDSLDKNLPNCPNLVVCEPDIIYDSLISTQCVLKKLFDDNNNYRLFPKLQTFYMEFNGNTDSRLWDLFVQTYGQTTVRSIVLTIDSNCNYRSIESVLTGLAQIARLVHLKLDIISDKDRLPVDQLLELLNRDFRRVGTDCRKLVRLSLGLKVHYKKLTPQLIRIINESFGQLRHLELRLGFPELVYELRSEKLADCKQLTHLSIESLNGHKSSSSSASSSSSNRWSMDSFFKDMDINLPKLVYLSINSSRIQINDKLVDQLLSSVRNCQLIRRQSDQQLVIKFYKIKSVPKSPRLLVSGYNHF